MRLSVRDVANLFEVSEATVYRWITDEELPAYEVEGQSRLHRAEVLEWASARDITPAPDLFERAAFSPDTSVVAALERGGIHLGLPAVSRDAVLGAIVDRLPIEPRDRATVLEVMRARPDFGKTGLSEGIAIPHVRQPIVLDIAAPVITLCVFDRSFPNVAGNDDATTVNAVFTLVTASVRTHLVMLSRLAFAVHMNDVRRALDEREPGAILAALSSYERAASDARAVDLG